MKLNFRIISSIALVAVSSFMLGSCDADPDSAGLEYMPDMYRSPAIEPYVDYGEVQGRANDSLKMLQSALTPPNGTIPYYGTDEDEISLMLPYARKANKSFRLSHGMFNAELSDQDEYALAASDMNPLTMTADNSADLLKLGKKLFIANCAHCHGEKGDGNGLMMSNGVYAGVPDYANLKELSDGQMFYSIYYGKGMMGSHNSIINKKEIWTVIHHIRSVQDENYGKTPGLEMSDSLVVAEISIEEPEVEHSGNEGH